MTTSKRETGEFRPHDVPGEQRIFSNEAERIMEGDCVRCGQRVRVRIDYLAKTPPSRVVTPAHCREVT